jgi:hypothetical protein
MKTILLLLGSVVSSYAVETATRSASGAEVFHFSGVYCWQENLPIAVTLRRSDPQSLTFTAVWSAYWPDGKGDGWHRYEGPFTLDQGKQNVSGSGKHAQNVGGTFSGSFKGKFPEITMDLTYTGGNYNGPRTLKLSPGPLVKDPIIMTATVQDGIAAEKSLGIKAQILNRQGKPQGTEITTRLFWLPDSDVRANGTKIHPDLLWGTETVRLTTARTGEGFVVRQAALEKAPFRVTGRVVSVDVAKRSAVVSIPLPKEESQVTVWFGSAKEFSLPTCKDPEAALTAIPTDAKFTAQVLGVGERWAASSFTISK